MPNRTRLPLRGLAAVMLILAAPAAMAADPAAGKSAFQAACGICHSAAPDQNKIGPTLFGVVGRQTGAVAAYSYSPANKDAHMTWDVATLDRYLQAPRAVISGTKMTYAGMKDDEKRANLIAYLATLK